jgi:hypothetical protein
MIIKIKGFKIYFFGEKEIYFFKEEDKFGFFGRFKDNELSKKLKDRLNKKFTCAVQVKEPAFKFTFGDDKVKIYDILNVITLEENPELFI